MLENHHGFAPGHQGVRGKKDGKCVFQKRENKEGKYEGKRGNCAKKREKEGKLREKREDRGEKMENPMENPGPNFQEFLEKGQCMPCFRGGV